MDRQRDDRKTDRRMDEQTDRRIRWTDREERERATAIASLMVQLYVKSMSYRLFFSVACPNAHT
jgi:hypothetical protein